MEHFMDNIALSLYRTYIDLQKSVNRFEKEINKEKSDSVIHNGLNRKRIKIGLCGHYSAGKTTLLKRLFSGYAGAISSDPQTACLTIHRLDSFQGITIKFKEKFSVNPGEKDKFKKFLEDNKLENYVKQVSEIDWKSCQKEEVSPDYRISDTKRFLESVNHYMYAIEKIYWCHKKANNDTENTLDFLEIYDLPGFGGQEAHEDIIKNIIQNESFDILICLIDSSQGLPTEKDIETLNNLSSTLEKNNPELNFYWAYEQPMDDDINLETCLDGINEAISGKLTNHFFQKAILLDLTGDKEDTEIPQNVLLKQVLSVYFQKIGNDYLESQKSFWHKKQKTVPELQLKPILDRIHNESKDGAVKREQAEEIFKEMLQLDFSITKKTNPDIKKLIKKLKKTENDEFEYTAEDIRELDITSQEEQICKTCQEIMDYICTPITNKIDVSKLYFSCFSEKYKKEEDWILLPRRITHYHILKNYESVRNFFLYGIGKEIYNDIEQSLKQIDRIVDEDKELSKDFEKELSKYVKIDNFEGQIKNALKDYVKKDDIDNSLKSVEQNLQIRLDKTGHNLDIQITNLTEKLKDFATENHVEEKINEKILTERDNITEQIEEKSNHVENIVKNFEERMKTFEANINSKQKTNWQTIIGSVLGAVGTILALISIFAL